jgi:hypothetical protein
MTYPPGAWDEPDKAALDGLTNYAMFAASSEALKPGPPSRIPHPDGGKMGETPNERTTRVVRAALRMLLANKLISVTPPDQRGEYIVLDPPPESP